MAIKPLLGRWKQGFIRQQWLLLNTYGGIDPAVQALLDQAATDGYTAASGSTLTALDTYVKGLKADGIWDKLDLLYVFATNGDSDFATYNIKDPANFQATKVNAPTFTSLEGFTGDGLSSYLNTNFTPSTDGVNYTLNSASYGLYKRTNAANANGVDMGVIATSNNFIREYRNATSANVAVNQGSANTFSSPITSLGLHFANRKISTNIEMYDNGLSHINLAANSTSLPTGDLYIFAINNGGSAANFRPTQASIAFIGGDLSAEASDFYTHTQNYMTAIGKEV